MAELNASGNVTVLNTFGANGLISSGSTERAWDPSGNLATYLAPNSIYPEEFGTDAWGNPWDPDANPYGFSGQFGAYDDGNATGLVLMGFRYYDPQTGRFLTKDPIGYAGGLNLYGYAGNNPVNYADPLGLLRVGNWEIPNGTIAAGLTTGGVMLLGGPVTWAVGGGWALGAAYSYFVDRHSGMDSLGEGAAGALIGYGGVTAAQAAGSAWTLWRASAGPGGASTAGLVGSKGGATPCPTSFYHYTDPSTADLIERSQLGLPGRDLYLTPNGSMTPLQAQIELALPPNNPATAVFRVPSSALDPSAVTHIGRVQGNLYNRAGGGVEVIYQGTIPTSEIMRIR